MVVAVLLVAGVAAGLRVATLKADLPYTAYIDEHFPLKASARQLADRSWDPHFYGYPSFLMDATTVTASALGVARGDVGVLRDGARVTIASRYIDIIEPSDLILAGRLVVLLLSIGTVLVVALLGTRLAGRRVGVLSALVVAVLPMFVTRGAIVIVDTPAAFFATLALYCAARVDAAKRRRDLATWVALGGAASALAFTSKYTIGSVLLAVLAVVALRRDRSIVVRLKLAAVAIASFVLVAVLVMPALVLRTSDVIDAVRGQQKVYDAFPATPSYIHQLFDAREVGTAMFLVALAGLVVMLATRRTRSIGLAYLAFAVPMLIVLLPPAFQPARNLVPLVPFLAIAAVIAVVRGVDLVARAVSLPRGVQIGAASVIVIALCWAPFADGTRAYIEQKRGHVDTRRVVRDWLASRVRPGDRVLVSQELAFLPSDLADLCARVTIQSQQGAATMPGYDWVVLGDLDGPKWPPLWRDALAGRPVAETVGRYPTSGQAGSGPLSGLLEDVWHSNVERIHVVGPAATAVRGPRRGRCPAPDRRVRTVEPVVLRPGVGAIAEGDAGTSALRVPFSLSRRAITPVDVTWRTLPPALATSICARLVPGRPLTPATPGTDFVAGSGAVTVPAGSRTGAVVVDVTGDRTPEPDECVAVSLATTTPGVRLGGVYGVAIGEIRDDDRP